MYQRSPVPIRGSKCGLTSPPRLPQALQPSRDLCHRFVLFVGAAHDDLQRVIGQRWLVAVRIILPACVHFVTQRVSLGGFDLLQATVSSFHSPQRRDRLPRRWPCDRNSLGPRGFADRCRRTPPEFTRHRCCREPDLPPGQGRAFCWPVCGTRGLGSALLKCPVRGQTGTRTASALCRNGEGAVRCEVHEKVKQTSASIRAMSASGPADIVVVVAGPRTSVWRSLAFVDWILLTSAGSAVDADENFRTLFAPAYACGNLPSA